MSNYKQTLALLDRLIFRLEANTGGEPILPGEGQPQKQQKPVQIVPVQLPVAETLPPAEEVPEKKEVAKKAKGEGRKPAGKAEPEKPKLPEGTDPEVLIFAEVDLRVSEIVECWKHPQSQNLYCEKILVGGQEPREIASGLQQFVALEDMRGKVIVMANLKPRPLAGFNSNGMVVCASNHEHTKVELLVPEGVVGQRLYLEGLEDLFPAGEVAVVKKSKVLEKVVEHFATDAEGFVVWKGYRLRTKAGFIRSTIQSGKVS